MHLCLLWKILRGSHPVRVRGEGSASDLFKTTLTAEESVVQLDGRNPHRIIRIGEYSNASSKVD